MTDNQNGTKRFLLASDFDQTLSFNDSGMVLSELLGADDFREKVHGLGRINLVQQGGELAYLLLHDPEYRRVRKHHLIEVGKRIRLKQNIHMLSHIWHTVRLRSGDRRDQVDTAGARRLWQGRRARRTPIDP